MLKNSLVVKIIHTVKQSKLNQDFKDKLILKKYVNLTPFVIRPIDSGFIHSWHTDFVK